MLLIIIQTDDLVAIPVIHLFPTLGQTTTEEIKFLDCMSEFLKILVLFSELRSHQLNCSPLRFASLHGVIAGVVVTHSIVLQSPADGSE